MELPVRGPDDTSLRDELNEIALRAAARPLVSDLTEDEILGYDEFGVPTR